MSNEKAKRGAKSNFRGFKLAFLKLLTVEFVTWRAEGQAGAFYDYVVKKFFRKFGFTKEGKFNIEPLVDPEEPPDDDKDAMESGCRTQAEADHYKARFAELRKIFTNWFRHDAKGVTSVPAPIQPATAKTARTARKATALELGPLAKLLGSGSKPPYRRSAFAHYQDIHFTERVSPEYKRRWALEVEKYKELTPEQRLEQGVLKPVSVRTMTATSAAMWRKELPAFRDGVQAEADAFHSAALKQYELILGTPKTPLDYHEQLMTISQHLQPIAEAIAAQTGADVAIFLVGPIPSRQGQLEARSISATRPGASRSTRNWVLDDPEGVTYTEQRLVDYARGNFTNAECAMRAIPIDQIPKGQDSEVGEMIELDEILQQEDREYDEADSDELTPAMKVLAASAEEELRTIDSNISVPAILPSAPTVVNTASLIPPLPSTSISSALPRNQVDLNHDIPIPEMTSLAPSTTAHAGSALVVIPPETTAPAPSTTTHTGSAPVVIPPETTAPAPFAITHTASVPVPSDITLGRATPAVSKANLRPAWWRASGYGAHASQGSSTPQPVFLALPGRTHAPALLTSVTDTEDYFDGEEVPVATPWRTAVPSSPIEAAHSSGSPVAGAVIETTMTLQDPLQSAPLPPLGRATSKPLPPTLPPTIHVPGFTPGRRPRPFKDGLKEGIHPRIMETLSVTTKETFPSVSEPPPALMTPSTPVRVIDLIPDYMRWPAWECKGFKWLVSDAADWGDWQATIRMLMDYRQEAGFPNQTAFKFSSPSPSEVGEWEKTARRWYDVEITDVVTFGAQYHVWWQALQPTERRQCTSTTLPAPLNTMDWTGLRKPGLNGLLLVAVALRWWGKATGADASWRAAAQDFHLAMQCIYHESHAPVAVEQAPVNARAIPEKPSAVKKPAPKSSASTSSEMATASGPVSAYATRSKGVLNTSSIANISATTRKRKVVPLPSSPPAKRARRQ